MRNNADEIAQYFSKSNSGTKPRAFKFTHSYPIGYGVKKGGKQIQYGLKTSEIIIKYTEDSPYGFIILTGTASL